ncbi:hypothetical protein BKA62DRAFT_676038 [Auriculariales sp. MPI-PUGE-AT-0066]|nr:hypothetical protein BKA62DRAFT_676038 [Auriculariales sp. MPI-PUGE-AT-0066]
MGAHNRIGERELIIAECYVAYRDGGNDRPPDVVELAIGMEVVVTYNLQTELDIANGSRGEIVDTILHQDEPDIDRTSSEVTLQNPPAYILVKLRTTRAKQLKGLDQGVVPVTVQSSFFSIDIGNGRQTVERQQPHGQTLAPVIVDLATPATGGELSPFKAYVACSRAKGGTPFDSFGYQQTNYFGHTRARLYEQRCND